MNQAQSRTHTGAGEIPPFVVSIHLTFQLFPYRCFQKALNYFFLFSRDVEFFLRFLFGKSLK